MDGHGEDGAAGRDARADVVNRYVASQALAQLCAVVDFEYVKEVAGDFEVGVWVWCNA